MSQENQDKLRRLLDRAFPSFTLRDDVLAEDLKIVPVQVKETITALQNNPSLYVAGCLGSNLSDIGSNPAFVLENLMKYGFIKEIDLAVSGLTSSLGGDDRLFNSKFAGLVKSSKIPEMLRRLCGNEVDQTQLLNPYEMRCYRLNVNGYPYFSDPNFQPDVAMFNYNFLSGFSLFVINVEQIAKNYPEVIDIFERKLTEITSPEYRLKMGEPTKGNGIEFYPTKHK